MGLFGKSKDIEEEQEEEITKGICPYCEKEIEDIICTDYFALCPECKKILAVEL